MHWYWGIIPDDLLFSSFGVCFVGFCFLILLFSFSQSFFLGERFSTVVSYRSSFRRLRRKAITQNQLYGAFDEAAACATGVVDDDG